MLHQHSDSDFCLSAAGTDIRPCRQFSHRQRLSLYLVLPVSQYYTNKENIYLGKRTNLQRRRSAKSFFQGNSPLVDCRRETSNMGRSFVDGVDWLQITQSYKLSGGKLGTASSNLSSSLSISSEWK